MHRSARSLFAVSLASLLTIGGCAATEKTGSSGGGAGGGTTGAGPAGAGAGDAIPIGVDIETSGPAAVQGSAYKDAVTLVADQINARGGVLGRKIQLVIRDNKSDPTEALQVAKGMITNDKVVAIVGGGSSPTTLSFADTVETMKVPAVSMGSSGAIVNPPEKRRYMFKTPANTELVVQKMLDDFAKRGVKSVGFLSVDNPYGQAGLQGFQKAQSDGKIALLGTEKFQATDKDYTAQVTKLVSQKPDAVVTWAIPPGAGIAAQNIRSSGFTGKVYFDAGAGAELFIKGAGAAAEGIYMVHPTVLVAPQAPPGAPNLKQMQDFYATYTQRYGDFSGFASYAADALNLIVAAIEKAGSTDRDRIRDALEALTYTGVTGVFTMSPTDHSGLTADALSVLTVKSGKWAPAG